MRTSVTMEKRWLHLVIAVALTQGVLSLSPIPVAEEVDAEWVEFVQMLRDPAFRLPTTSRPRHYVVTLTPYFDSPPANVPPFSFDGEVVIYISPTVANLSEIVMHCNDLTIQTLSIRLNNVEIAVPDQNPVCEMPYSFLRLRTTQVLQLGQEYEVRMTFRGNLQTNMRGFYRSWYNDNTTRRWMATTQFQPGHARQAFPCYDEPGFKATFDITINREASFSPTISNTPIRSTVTLPDGRISETFYTTPFTSTYLLAFIVSHYERVATNNNQTRPFHIYARNNAGSTGDFALEIGVKLLDEMEAFAGIDYYPMAENLDMKQAAIPDFSAGAMENWGLLTYREALILYDPLNTNHHYKQRIANIISHEITHMWFGNLVTCAWWDNLWLNEGFARLFQYFLTQSVAPEMGYDTRFIVEQVQVAMVSDSVDSAHPLTDLTVNDPASVSAHFSTITYARGAAIIRMTNSVLGFQTFRKGLRYYLDERRFDVAEPHHLFSAWDRAAEEDGALAAYGGITIDRYFRSWSEKAGHPLLTVSVDHTTGRIVITQARWERNTGVSQLPSLWDIPITWTRGNAPDFEDLKPSLFMTAQTLIINRQTIGLEWVIFNKQVTAFYRVNYDDTNWALLTNALRGTQSRTVIHENNRAQIVDDLFALARAGVMQYSRAFNIISFLEFEDGYGPWIAAVNGFTFALRRLAHDSANVQRLRNEIIRLSSAVTRRLGYAEIDGEPFMDGLLRMHLLTFLCNVGHPQCVAAGRENFQRWRNGGYIPANMRPWVYCVGLRTGTADDFNFFWNRTVVEDLANEKIVMLEAAGCTLDQGSLFTYLDAITDGLETVRPQDISVAFASAVTGNEENTLRVLTWLSNNLQRTITNIGSAATPISNIASRLLNEEQIATFQSFLEQNQVVLGTAYNTGINGIATVRENLAWSARRMPEFTRYFDVGYVPDVIDDVNNASTPTPAPAPTEAPTTQAPGAANITVLSVVTLLATVLVALSA